jgi:sugar phosphate isomerase/epimerase
MKLACSTGILQGKTIREKINFAAKCGFDGVEVGLPGAEATSLKIREIMDCLQEAGLKASSLITPGEIFRRRLDSEETFVAKLDYMKRALDIAAELKCPALVNPEYGFQNPLPLFDHPKRPGPYERELLIRYLSAVNDYAAHVGTIALVEPINRYETHFYYSLGDATWYLDQVGGDNLRILADFFHMSIEEADIALSLKAAAGYLGHIHLADSNRLLPGMGHTNFRPGFSILRESGYDGFMALECAAPGNLEIELPKCVQYLRDQY